MPLRDDEFEVSPSSRRPPYKSVLAAVVVGIAVIAALWLINGRRAGDAAEVSRAAQSKVPGTPVIAPREPKTTSGEKAQWRIEGRLDALTDRIDQGFKSQAGQGSELKRRLAIMGDTLHTIEMVVTDLDKSNQSLAQQIRKVTTKLDVLARNVRVVRDSPRKPAARSRPRPAKVPPFRVDGIDVWDDTTYVAVSRDGRVAFLKQGDRRAGWSVTRIDRLQGKVAFRGPVGQVYSMSSQR